MARKKLPPAPPPASTAPDQAEPNKGGRPSSYAPGFVEVARRLCDKLGATDMDLARWFEVDERTIRRWRVEHPEFAAACKLGKDPADDRVERSLYHRAVGYTYEAEKIYCEGGKVTRVPYIEHVPPDAWSAFKWLINRRPDTWRDKVDILATVKPADVSAEPLTPDEWDRRHSPSRPS